MAFQDILGNICGFLVVIVAIILLNTFKDMDVSLNDVRGVWRPKRELLSSSSNNKSVIFDEESGRSRQLRLSYGTPDSF